MISSQRLSPYKKESDISWDLANTSNANLGRIFIKSLCRYIPVYSQGARQIYSEGECYFTSDNKVVFLANTGDHTKTFSRIPPEAIFNTTIYFFRSKNAGVHFLQKTKDSPIKIHEIKKTLIKIIKDLDGDKDTFIPILQKSTIHDASDGSPCIRVSSIKLSVLKNTTFSDFDAMMLKSHCRFMLKTMLANLS